MQKPGNSCYLIRKDPPVYGLPLPGGLKRYDTGNFEGYVEAFSAFADRG